MAISLYDPDTRIFSSVDGGQQAQATLSLNILIELRVQTNILLAVNAGIVMDDPEQLRMDVVNAVLPSQQTTLVNTNINN